MTEFRASALSNSDRFRSSLDFESQIKSSYEEPERFFIKLRHEVEETTGQSFHSALFQCYDVYSDCIVRHLGKNQIALRLWDKGAWREWSYDHIHRLVNYQVNRWRNQQESWRGTVAIAAPLGIHYIVALLTAIRLKFPFASFPLDSPLLPPKRLRALLDQLKPEILFTSPEASSTISGKERHWLIEYLEESTKYEQEKDSLYKPEELFQVAFSSHLQNEPLLCPLTAQETYLNALRDGYLTFELKPKKTWGYSPDCSLREQPHLLLTALLLGATTLLLPDRELEQNPRLAEGQLIDLLGVTPKLRDLWSGQGGFPKARLSRWYHSLFCDDEKAWALFSKANSLEKIPSKRLMIDNASGGVPLTSIKMSDEERDPLWPSLGSRWDLLQYGQQKVSSLHYFGVFKHQSAANLPSNLLLTAQRVGWEVAAVVTPQIRGYTIPVSDLEKAVEELEFVEHAFFITLPLPQRPLTKQMILVLFVDPLLLEELPKQQSQWKEEINEAIRKNLGATFIPDKIELFPLIPKVEEDVLDRNWCYQQYTSGRLHRKKSLKLYHWLSLLKKAASE